MPPAVAAVLLRSRDVRRAVARVVVDPARDRVHLVLWVGVDARWFARAVARLLADRTDVPVTTPSAQRVRLTPRAKEPRMLPAGALAC